MRPYLTLVFLIALLVVQTAALPFATPGPLPLLPVLAVVAWGLLFSRWEAAWWGLTLGCLMDLFFSGSPFGTYTVPMIVAVAVVAVGGSNLFPTNFMLPGVVAAAATLAFTLVQRGLLTMMIRGNVAWNATAVSEDVVPVVALNLLWLPVLYFPLRYVARQIGPPRIEWER